MADVELAAGSVIGSRYRLERAIGAGGMGEVWAVVDLVTGEPRALKLMKERSGDRRRFLREGRAAAAVQHPNVVVIFDVLDLEDAPPAIAMELLDGESLRTRLEREVRLSLADAAEVLVPVVSAVGTAHALGVVHRDLKPENIFLARGAVKVLDFGIAKLTALDGEAMRSTGITTGTVLGTPAYMAPEQVFGEHDLDHRADIWALGVVLYECLSGTCPTRGANVGQVLKHVVARPFPPLDGVPPAIAALVAGMLARDRAERPADLREVLRALEPYARAPGPAFGPPASVPAAHAETVPVSPALVATAAGVDPARARPERAGRAASNETGAARARRRRGARLGAAAAIAAVAAVAAVGARGALRGSGSDEAPPALLAARSSRLACPVLRASGVAEPAGWLGAAAAAAACERARVLLGGRPERVLVPAELLELPRGPADAFPRDPYGAAGARERSIDAARRRAQAYLDGEVTRVADRFGVALELRAPDGRAIAAASGEGRALYEAVRAALDGLVGDNRIPRAAALEPAIEAWSRTTDVGAALGALDLAFALAHNAGELPEECRRFADLGPRARELAAEGRRLCAYTLGRPPPDLALDASDRSDPAVATQIRIAHSHLHTTRAGDAELLRGMFAHEATARGRSLLAATESCVRGSSDPQAARELAIIAVQSDPTNPEGGWCNPWEQLLTLERDTPAAPATVRAMQAWVPWNSYAWVEPGYYEAGGTTAIAELQRAYVLSPFDTQIAATLAATQLAAGDRAASRGIALALRAGGQPVHEVGSNLLLVRIETSEARFGAALDRARRGAEPSAGDAGWLRAQRFELAWRAFELAELLGRARELADWLVAAFVDPDPPLLDSNLAAVPMRVPAICAAASAPERCFLRFRALRDSLPGAITTESDAFLLGAERYVKRDFAGAAAAWRPLLGGRLVLASAMPAAMVDALERTDAAELAERVDAGVMQRAGELDGATPGHVRAARRAFARGDRARAKQLAEQVVAAWSLADEAPPALAEMRRLLTQLAR